MRAPVEDKEGIPARDHLGKNYVSMTAMAKAWGISEHLLITRLGRGWSLEDALVNAPGEKRRCIDHKGNKFFNLQAMATAYGLTRAQLIKRLSSGWSLKRALTTPIRPYVRVR